MPVTKTRSVDLCCRKSHIHGPEAVFCGVSSGRPFRDWTPHFLQSHWLSCAVIQEFPPSTPEPSVFALHCLVGLQTMERWFSPCSCMGASRVGLQWNADIKETNGCTEGISMLSPKAAYCVPHVMVWLFCLPVLLTSMPCSLCRTDESVDQKQWREAAVTERAKLYGRK